jgi:two-component system nitrate/nitrite response regulator NarL
MTAIVKPVHSFAKSEPRPTDPASDAIIQMMAEARDDPEGDLASRVLIIDDSAAVRQGLRALVETDASLRAVGEASNATEGLELARTLSPDLILLDNEMPGMRGIELLPVLLRELPGTRVVMFTLSPAISDEAQTLGASAVVSKDGGDATLLETLRQVRRGDRSTTVRLATVARLRRDRLGVSAPRLGIVLAVFAGYVIVVSALAGAVSAENTTLVLGGSALGAIVVVAIVAGSGALRPLTGRRYADQRLGEATGASVGADDVVRRIRAALGCDAAMLFALSSAGRRVRVVSTAGVTDFDAERTFLGLPALARSVREARIVETSSSDDLVADASSAVFAPIIAPDGTPLGAIVVFYRRKVALTHPDQRRLRAAAIAAETAIEGAR